MQSTEFPWLSDLSERVAHDVADEVAAKILTAIRRIG